jgi:peptidyl-prolyl cis-trans isomerase B (cyclophilin B)
VIRAAAILVATLLVACGSASAPSTATPRVSVAATRTAAAATSAGTPCAPIAAGIATKVATIELAKGGVIQLALRPDKTPNTVATFTTKANSGFYNGLTFHRVEPGFVVQGGDPQGNGFGGGQQPTELSDLPFCVGAIGIARGGDIRVSNDSQFFICIGQCRFLDGMYTNFGQVTSGMDVATGIKIGDKMKTVSVK